MFSFIQGEVLLKSRKRQLGKKKISYQQAEAMVLGHPGRMEGNLSAEFFMAVRHPIYFACLIRCDQCGPLSERPLSA